MMVASGPMPLYPHINDYTVTSTCKSNALYNVTAALQTVVLQAIPIPFSSTNRFQYWDVEGGSGDLRPHYASLYGSEFTRVNEIAEHVLILTHEQDHYGTYSL